MLAYTVRRLLGTIPLLLAASILTFLLIDLSGDPLADLRVQQPPVPEEVIKAEEARLYLDRSLPERYVLWLTGIGGNGDIGLLRGKFGPSVQGADYDIGHALAERLGTTLRLVSAALLLALGLAILSGVISALRQYSMVDYTLTLIGFLALAMPTFWLGALIKEAGVWVNQQTGYTIFYTVGATSADTRGFTTAQLLADHLGHLVLPTLTLMLTGYAAWSRYQRTSMLEVLNSDYVRLARAKGLPNRVVLRRHALRTALIPLTTVSPSPSPEPWTESSSSKPSSNGAALATSSWKRSNATTLMPHGLADAQRDRGHHRQPHCRPALRRTRPEDPL